MKDVKCPYCGEEQDICHDDGYGYEEDVVHEQECFKCEKVFGYYTTVSFYHEAHATPCKNGEPHKFKDMVGHPKGFLSNRHRCEYCDEVYIIDNTLKYDCEKDEWSCPICHSEPHEDSLLT